MTCFSVRVRWGWGVCVCVTVCHVYADTLRSQKRAFESLDLELYL